MQRQYRRRRAAEEVAPVVGWRDEPPDTTTGEHDTLVAMVELAWRDVQIDLSTIPASRREEALAAKVSAWEWIAEPPRADPRKGAASPRIGFREACLHLGMNVKAVRFACLNKDWRPPHKLLSSAVQAPHEPMPSEWREVFFGPDEPEKHRSDRAYIKRKRTQTTAGTAEAVAPVQQSAPAVPQVAHAPSQDAATPTVPPNTPAVPPEPLPPAANTPNYCPALDSRPEHHTLADLVASVTLPTTQDAAASAMSPWERAVADYEADD